MWGAALPGVMPHVSSGTVVPPTMASRTRVATRASPRSTSYLLLRRQVEGAELDVLRSLSSILGQIQNLIVEVSPGWWQRSVNATRAEGADLLVATWRQGGYRAALTHAGVLLETADALAAHVRRMVWRGLHSQQDVWLTRDPALLRSARARLVGRTRNASSTRLANEWDRAVLDWK